MKKTLLVLAALLATAQSASSIVFNIREGKAGFEVVKIIGIEVNIAPEVAVKLDSGLPSGHSRRQLLADAHRVFAAAKKIMPATYREFVNKEYKVYFLHEAGASNGLEYIRKGQETWDRRIPRDGSMSKSIMIFRTFDFFDPPFDTFYFVHEMAHFHHIDLNNYRDLIIQSYYDKVVVKNKKFKTLYASKNHMEYFADISATYLMARQLNPRHGMPKGAAALKRYSPLSHEMCEIFWRSEKTDFKPKTKLAPKVDDIPMPQISFEPPTKHKETRSSLAALYEVERSVRTGAYYEELSRHGWTTEGSATATKRKSFEAYYKAYNKLISFERKFPNHNINKIKKLLNQKVGMIN